MQVTRSPARAWFNSSSEEAPSRCVFASWWWEEGPPLQTYDGDGGKTPAESSSPPSPPRARCGRTSPRSVALQVCILTALPSGVAHDVALQVGFERQTLKPGFHLIGHRLWVRKAIGYGLWVNLIQRAAPHRGGSSARKRTETPAPRRSAAGCI
jgi:hypothetical protein